MEEVGLYMFGSHTTTGGRCQYQRVVNLVLEGYVLDHAVRTKICAIVAPDIVGLWLAECVVHFTIVVFSHEMTV